MIAIARPACAMITIWVTPLLAISFTLSRCRGAATGAAMQPTDRGDVREALINAGVSFLAQHRDRALSLRQVAALAGVSHAAPAHHFDGLPGLRLAIAMRGFEMFHAELAAATPPRKGDDFARLLSSCMAYIAFADTRRGLFRLMFDEIAQPTPELSQVASRSYMTLRDACAPFITSPDQASLETSVWSLAHGFAALGLGRPRPPSAPFQPPSFEVMLRRLVLGQAAA